MEDNQQIQPLQPKPPIPDTPTLPETDTELSQTPNTETNNKAICLVDDNQPQSSELMVVTPAPPLTLPAQPKPMEIELSANTSCHHKHPKLLQQSQTKLWKRSTTRVGRLLRQDTKSPQSTTPSSGKRSRADKERHQQSRRNPRLEATVDGMTTTTKVGERDSVAVIASILHPQGFERSSRDAVQSHRQRL
ncbi:di-glucose binding protein with Kinesin motor domain [Striga asiatica]|uniref:Di-glucose binding protein with Kinesin motor domain n=1 Tax=Striga asiatica TaxID=4170 RepID=A0A5A7PWE2_STRAF|nr:di-glucose binding protein with Kinesin motor domain [Striga asiatica]